MEKPGKRYSKAAVASFILAVVPVVIYLAIVFADMFFRKPLLTANGYKIIRILTDIGVTAFCASFVAGLVLSIVGLVQSIRKKLRGKVLAIISIVIYQIEIIMGVFALILSLAMALSGDIRPAQQP